MNKKIYMRVMFVLALQSFILVSIIINMKLSKIFSILLFTFGVWIFYGIDFAYLPKLLKNIGSYNKNYISRILKEPYKARIILKNFEDFECWKATNIYGAIEE